jgi:hypothetical protein
MPIYTYHCNGRGHAFRAALRPSPSTRRQSRNARIAKARRFGHAESRECGDDEEELVEAISEAASSAGGGIRINLTERTSSW